LTRPPHLGEKDFPEKDNLSIFTPVDSSAYKEKTPPWGLQRYPEPFPEPFREPPLTSSARISGYRPQQPFESPEATPRFVK
jgi:hypothetical protein